MAQCMLHTSTCTLDMHVYMCTELWRQLYGLDVWVPVADRVVHTYHIAKFTVSKVVRAILQ